MKISTILSDYDGTLAPIIPTDSNHSTSDKDYRNNHFRIDNSSIVPPRLTKVLIDISKRIPIGVISSKDFRFLHSRTVFASVISCIMGIENIKLSHHESISCHRYNCVQKSVLNIDIERLKKNLQILSILYDEISINFKDIIVDRKFTFNQSVLAGITIDWRHIRDWIKYKKDVEPLILERIHNKIINNAANDLYVQKYSTHPFVDVYSVKCSKDIAYDKMVKQLGLKLGSHIMYLGDSENDNAVFRKADISIGISSDSRLNSRLDCQYMIDFIKLPRFLNNLNNNDLVFNEQLLDL